MAIEKRKLTNRYFTAIFYEEDPNYNKYMTNIIDNFEEFAYIDHKKDIDEYGDPKKTHTHIVFKVGENARHRKAIAKIIDCPENMIEGCNRDKMLLYLIHKNNPEKTQYDPSEVQGTLKDELINLLNKNIDTSQKLKNIILAIRENHITNITDLVHLIIEANYTDILKSYQYILKMIIDEEKIRPQ